MNELREKFRAESEKPRKSQVVIVPEFGAVTVVALSGDEYDQFESACVINEGKTVKTKTNRALLIRLGVVGDDGKKIFRDEDMGFLKNLGSNITVPLADAIMRLSGATKEESEVIEKN